MLQHAALEVPPDTVQACIDFWRLLGFTPMEKPPKLQTSSTWLEHEGTQIHLMPTPAPAIASKGHLAVVALDYEQTVLALTEAGFTVRPELDAWDAPRSTVRDPAGHLIEIMTSPPP